MIRNRARARNENSRQAIKPNAWALAAAVICLVHVSTTWGVRCGDERPWPKSFELHLVDGRTIEGSLEELRPEWLVRLAGKETALAREMEWLSLRRSHTKVPGSPTGEQIILANGDRLHGLVTRIVRDRLILGPCCGSAAEMRIPLSSVSVIWIAPPQGTADPLLLPRKLGFGRRRHDSVRLRNGDSLDGIVSAFDRDKQVRVKASQKEIVIDFDKVSAVAFSTELMRNVRPIQAYGHMVLRDGSRLSLASLTLSAGRLTGRTMIGTDIDLPLSELVSLDLYHAGADYLSDQKPKKYEFRPYLGSLQWPYTYDSNVLGGDLLLAGSACDKGVGMHSASRLSYDLQGKYRYFETLVGLDSHSEREGSARVQVWVDGKPRLDRHQEVTAKSQPLSIREEIAGANELILEVDFGSYGDVQARVNWGAARVIR